MPGVHQVPDRNGSASGIVDVLKLSEVLDAIAILKLAGSGIFPYAQQTTFNSWVATFFDWYNTNILGKQARTAGVWWW